MRKNITKLRWPLIAMGILLSFGLTMYQLAPPEGTMGPTMTTETWPAGAFLSHFPEGDRINTYHRNYLMIAGQEGTGIWDISNPTAPERVQFDEAANNGHRWWKMGDLYYREYSVPEVEGTGYKYLDLSNMLDRKPVTSSDVLYTVADDQPHYDNLETFPHTIVGDRVFDMRSGELVSRIKEDISQPDIVVRIGNYVFYTPQTGPISVFDFGDPKDIKFLGSFGDDTPHEQYSTGIQLWRNYLVFMSGNAGNNLVAFDISDPGNIKHGFDLSDEDITLGRYMIFQDEFGFTGRFDRGVKFNFETMEVAQEFIPPSSDETLQLLDNQWMPIGHIVVASGDGKTSIFSHQEELDTRPPTVGHHFPVAGATNQPVTSTLGFVINETLDDLTLTDENIQVSPLGGAPIQGDITSTSYQVINYAPKKPLLPNTTYEVKFVEGGIRDAVGNGMEEYVYYFTTGGDASNKSPEVSKIKSNRPSPILPKAKVTFTAEASDPEGNPLQYRWDFGDGSPKTDWTGASVVHQFTKTGNYTVQVQVSDGNGGFIVASKPVTVTAKLPEQKPTQSGPIAVDAKNRRVWTVNPDNNTVTVMDADKMTVLREIPVGKDPVSVAIDGNGKAWVTCRDSDEIYLLNAAGTTLAKIPLKKGAQPYGIVFNPEGNRGFVAAQGWGRILEVTPSKRRIVANLPIGPNPRALAITGDGTKLMATRFISNNKAGIVWEVDLDNFAKSGIKTVRLPIDDFSLDNGNAGRGVPNYVAGIGIHPNSKAAWTVAKKDNILRGKARDGKTLTFDNSVRTAISNLDLNTGKERLGKRLDIDNHGQPSAVHYSTTGNYIFLTMQGVNSLVAIDPKKGQEVLEVEVGKAPQGIAIDPRTKRIFVKNFMSRDVTVFDAKSMMLSGSVGLTKLGTIRTVDTELLTAEILKGKQLFYDASDIRMGADGYISCASCHIDGTQDGRTWDFTDRGEGLRNTISLRGRAGTAHGNVHWSANFDEIQDFENDIRFHFKGQGFMSDGDFNKGTTALTLGDAKTNSSADLDALAAYVISLDTFFPSPHRKNNGKLTPAAVKGKTIFNKLKCANCHSGEHFTDSNTGRMHDVGTIKANSGQRLGKKLQGLDVPTLRDVWRTAPYLHDGSAPTLRTVFKGANGKDGHGETSGLSAPELNQLLAYLQQIDGSEPAARAAMELAMASPKDGERLTRSEAVPLSVATNIEGITRIAYFVDGKSIGSSNKAPFTLDWEPILWKDYEITAKVFYNKGNTASVTAPITVKFKNTIEVMFVVGDEDLDSEDQRIKSHLEQQLGFAITVFADEDADKPELANPFDLVLVSSSVDPRVLGNDLESVKVPLMTWDPFMFNKLGMTSGEINTGFGFTTEAFPKITVSAMDHPMAAGIGRANVALYSITQPLPFGKPEEDAIIVAKAGDDAILFGYDIDGTTTSRRTAFPLRDKFLHLLSDEGWKMFDAAVLWTLHGGDADTPIMGLPDVYFKSPSEGQLVNTPLNIDFVTENWSLPSSQYKLRFLIDGQDRGLVSSGGTLTDATALSEGPHRLMLQMERADNSKTELGDTITVMVTNDPLPQGPSAIIESPFAGAIVKPDFDLTFSLFDWDIAPGAQYVRYSLDGTEVGDVFEIAPISFSGLADGDHTITLTLVNADGTLTDSETSITVTVDRNAANLPETAFKLKYFDNSSSSGTAELKPVFGIVNDSSITVDYADFTIRYWFTPEHTSPMEFNIDYSQVTDVTGTFDILSGTQHYVELGFSATSGSLAAQSESGQIMTRMHHAGFQSHDQSNDFSYDPGKSSLKLHFKATLYYKGELVWGLEPSASASARAGNLSPEETDKALIYHHAYTDDFHVYQQEKGSLQVLEVFDNSGRRMEYKNAYQWLGQQDVTFGTALRSGAYVVRLLFVDGTVETHKIIKD